jgi:hypothetical protein
MLTTEKKENFDRAIEEHFTTVKEAKKVGCEHNALRSIIFPDQKRTLATKSGKTFEAAQQLILFCPFGCSDILIELEAGGQKEEEMID